MSRREIEQALVQAEANVLIEAQSLTRSLARRDDALSVVLHVPQASKRLNAAIRARNALSRALKQLKNIDEI